MSISAKERATVKGIFEQMDTLLEPQLRDERFPTGTVLAVLQVFRDAARNVDPALAEELIAKRCEQAAAGKRERVTIRVRDTGHNNYARVLGKNVTASCTSSPEAAARAAAMKYFKLEKLTLGKEGSFPSGVSYEYIAVGRKAAA